jgi:hypothetical protein
VRDRLGRTRCGGYTDSNAMGDGSCAPLAETLAGDVLRTAAHAAFWKTARELRWVCKGVWAGGGPETRPQVAAGVARVAAAPTAEVTGLQPARDDGTPKAQSGPQPGAATRALYGPAPPPPPYPIPGPSH